MARDFEMKIETFIREFNQHWIDGKLDLLADLVDDDVVFLAPDLTTEIKGKVLFLQGFKDYLDSAKTKVFEVRSQQVHAWRASACVVLEYYVEYEMNETEHQEVGKEIWFLNQVDGAWKMVWRSLVGNQPA